MSEIEKEYNDAIQTFIDCGHSGTVDAVEAHVAALKLENDEFKRLWQQVADLWQKNYPGDDRADVVVAKAKGYDAMKLERDYLKAVSENRDPTEEKDLSTESPYQRDVLEKAGEIDGREEEKEECDS